MCFSATASFAVASLTGAIGLVTVRHVRSPREAVLGSFPIIFGVQQVIEGTIWLALPSGNDPALVRALAIAFVFVATVVWPAVVPVAVYLVEPDRQRKRLLYVPLAIGALVSLACLTAIIASPHRALIAEHSIQYKNDIPDISWWGAPYLLATVAPLFLSSHRPVQALGVLVSVGFIVSTYFYAETLTSVWCFFAAGASAILCFQFIRGFALEASADHPA
jgi:hypothetical protein